MNDIKKELLLKKEYGFDDLCTIMRILRSNNGCAWDKEQTHESIRKNFIEEAYEVCEAIDEKSPTHLCEELGDVLLQVVFHAEMENEKKVFDINDVTTGICSKLIHRHPHVFGEVNADTPEKVLANWDAIKTEEKKQTCLADELDGISKTLPSLMRMQKIAKKAAKYSYDLCAEKCDFELETREEYVHALTQLCKGALAKNIDLEELLEEKCNEIVKNVKIIDFSDKNL